jgi:hypothetical protein
MAEARSPNYPSMSLPTAIERARALYKRDGKAAIPIESAVRAWDYTSLNGRSLRALGALRAYGLLEYPEPKKVKLTARALTILLEPDVSFDRMTAVQEAALTPPIFAQLREQYSDGMPSDQSMISALVRGNFNEEAATKLISAFRATMDLAFDSDSQEVSGTSSGAEPPGLQGDEGSSKDFRKTTEKRMPDLTGQDARPYDLTLALMDGVQATLRIPRQMSADNYSLLTTLLDANLKAMKKALVRSATDGDPVDGV